jgi:NADH-quinone oxidoreductase subunit G
MEVKSATSERALEARKAVAEFLLINHPLDCPVCDQAGECDLQNLAYGNENFKSRFIEQKRTFEPEDIGPYIQLHTNRCILCYRCVKLADQLTSERVHGVMGRGDHAQISTYIARAIDTDFSGNVIDVCPVGALTDKTFRFKSRVWFNKPFDAHRHCTKCSGKVVLWMFGDTVQRVTARKDEWHEVEDFICNECRFEHKNVEDWTIERPRKFGKPSVINVNNYTEPMHKVEINTDELVLEGRKEDRKKISMASSPYDESELEAIKKTKDDK